MAYENNPAEGRPSFWAGGGDFVFPLWRKEFLPAFRGITLTDGFFIVADTADQQSSGPDGVVVVSEQIRNLLVGVAGFPLLQIAFLFPVKEDERVGDVQHVGSNRIGLELGLGDLENPSSRLPVELNRDSIFRGEDLNRLVKSRAIF